MERVLKKLVSGWIIVFALVLFMPTIDVEAVSKPKKTTITSIGSKNEGQITIKWKKVSCKGYKIQLATNSKFTKNKKTITVSSKNKTKTITSLKAGQKYYIRVRAYKKSGRKTKYGSWSAKKSVTVHKHSYVSKTTRNPSCSTAGIKNFSCKCGKKYSEIITENAHNFIPIKEKVIDKEAYSESVLVQVDTIHHEAVEGHYETQIVEEAYDEETFDEEGNPVIIHHDEVTEDVWVEGQEAYDEPVYEEQIVDHEEESHEEITGYKCTKCGIKGVSFNNNGVVVSGPLNTKSASSVVSVKNSNGKTLKYKIYNQRAKYNAYNAFISGHGCAECVLTTVLNAKVPALSNYTPDKVISVCEKTVFGTEAFNKNYSKMVEKQRAITLYGMTKVFKKYGVKYKHVFNFSKSGAEKDITEHLKKGNPVIIILQNTDGTKKWANSYHTMLLLGFDDQGRVIVGDSSDRTWSGNDQRVKYGDIDELISYMWSSSKSTSTVYWSKKTGSGGYLLIY